MTREQAMQLQTGEQVFIEGVSGLGYVERVYEDGCVQVRWRESIGIIYPDADVLPSISRLCRVGGDTP